MSQLESRFRHDSRLREYKPKQPKKKVMPCTFPRDPLDLEILEKAFEGAWVAVKQDNKLIDADSDKALEAALRRELMGIARSAGVSDAETLQDMLLAALANK